MISIADERELGLVEARAEDRVGEQIEPGLEMGDVEVEPDGAGRAVRAGSEIDREPLREPGELARVAVARAVDQELVGERREAGATRWILEGSTPQDDADACEGQGHVGEDPDGDARRERRHDRDGRDERLLGDGPGALGKRDGHSGRIRARSRRSGVRRAAAWRTPSALTAR